MLPNRPQCLFLIYTRVILSFFIFCRPIWSRRWLPTNSSVHKSRKSKICWPRPTHQPPPHTHPPPPWSIVHTHAGGTAPTVHFTTRTSLIAAPSVERAHSPASLATRQHGPPNIRDAPAWSSRTSSLLSLTRTTATRTWATTASPPPPLSCA